MESANTDSEGQAIHGECYALKVKSEQASEEGPQTE